MATPSPFRIDAATARIMFCSVALATAGIGRIANEPAHSRTGGCTDANADPGSREGTTGNTADSTANGRAADGPLGSGTGGGTASKGYNGPDHEKLTHD